MRSFAVRSCVLLSLLSVIACNGDQDDGVETSTAELVDAFAPSTHYVRLRFSAEPGALALDVTRYEIKDEAGQVLPLLSVARGDANEIVVATEAQREVTYTLSFDDGRPGTTTRDDGPIATTTASLRTLINFGGTTVTEAYIRDASSINNTQVIVRFSARVNSTATELDSYSIESPNLTITAAELSSDQLAVLLTTSPQEGLSYTLRTAGINVQGQARGLLDPTRSAAGFDGIPSHDTTAPRVVSAVATNNTTVVVTFSEALSDDAANPTNFSVAPGGVVTSAELSQWNTQVILHTLPLLPGVEYTVTAAAGIRDSARIPLDPTATMATFSLPEISDAGTLPRVVGAISTSNTTVMLRYSRPMNADAINAGNYAIVQENIRSEAGALIVTGARFLGTGDTTVELTTRSQNELTYHVFVSNVADRLGNPLAAPVTSQGVLVDPTSAIFAGTPPSGDGVVDSDGDGISDNVEQSGWIVTVQLTNGTTIERQVTSNPDDADTDRDLLADGTELLQGTDPRSGDTDGDGLGDNEEYNVVLSNPNDQDTDEDSVDDWLEVEFFKTNALVADSDGDGFDDADELFTRNRDPRVSDLPSHSIQIGNVNLALDERYTYTDDNGVTQTESSSTNTSLGTTNTSRNLSSGGVRIWAQAGLDAVGNEKLIPTWWEKFAFQVGVEGTANFESESVNEATRAFERSIDKGREISQGHSVTREVVGATVGIDFMLRNTSNVAFSISNLEIMVQVQAPDDPSTLVPLATLIPERTLLTGEDVVLNVAPGAMRGPIHMVSREVFPALVEDLMRAPRGLVFKVANFDVSAEDGRNFAFGMQEVNERTVGIFVDSGDGDVKQYQSITAGVLNRPRDEFRCAPVGDHPDIACTADTDCGTSTPCQGGSVIGGLSGFDGTGRNQGIPLDFVLQDVLQMPRTRQPMLLAGENGVANSTAVLDDVQIVAVGTTGLAADAVVIGPGHNLVLDTAPAGDDVNPAPYDGVKVGHNKVVNSIAQGDDVQLIPAGTRGVPEDAVAISAGENGVLDTALRGDDVADVVTGYEVSSTCDAETPYAILAGYDRRADSYVAAGFCSAVAPGALVIVGDRCVSDADCGAVTGVCHVDAQAANVGDALPAANSPVITADSDGFLASVPDVNDVYVGPGTPCTSDADCSAGSAGAGHCSGPQKIVRVGSRRDGEFRRFWTLMLPEEVQFQTDFGAMRVRAGDQIGLRFIQDLDRDGLSVEAELLAGSSDLSPDTDGDRLSDFQEVRVGWVVGADGQPLRHVYSDPRLVDSDRDGLSDYEEGDIRAMQCACEADGPEHLMSGARADACTSNDDCDGAICRSMVRCTAAMVAAGTPCPACSSNATRNRTDPRRSDSDGDYVRDFDEVLGYLTGAGIVDVGNARAILAGPDLIADTLACPDNHCEEDLDEHCSRDIDCRSHRCIREVPCDDVQVVPVGSGVQSPRTVVVAIGPLGYAAGALVTVAAVGDIAYVDNDGAADICDSRAIGDDGSSVGFNETASFGTGSSYQCVDGSRFNSDGVPLRFAMCSVIKPGANGSIESQPGSDDVLVPAGSGQRLEWTDPLNPDSDMDFIWDGFERVLGSSPNDPGDTGQAGDRDRDGLGDNQEAAGWTASHRAAGVPVSRTVQSNMYVPDTDLDGIPDYAERHMPCVGSITPLSGTNECPTDPTSPDTDRDGISDFDELSSETLAQLEAFGRFFPGFVLVVSDSEAYGTDPVNSDSDGDGVSDYEELFGSYRILLPDGSSREVSSDPRLADTDGDGLNDGDERTRRTDATNADTDGDQRSDGLDSVGGFSPTVPDLRVTLNVDRLDINKLNEPGSSAELGFWILVRSSVLATNPTLVASARNASYTAFTHEHTEPNGCEMINSNSPELTVQLHRSISFFLRSGQFFSVEGLIAEFDSESSDCGDPPEYIPSQYNAEGCFSRFSKSFNYSDISSGARGELIDFDATEGGVRGGDGCDWTLRTRLIID